MEKPNDPGGIKLQICSGSDCPRSMSAWCTPLYAATMCSVSEQEISDVVLISVDPESGSVYKEIPWKTK